MLKRQTRERREFLYRKANEAHKTNLEDKKTRLSRALRTGKNLPSDLKKDAHQLEKELQFDHQQEKIDDEYQRAGEIDPKILITTARDPSSRLTQFSKEMKLMFIYIDPGFQTLKE
jgi:U3 small nucleolar ribonucleoprotein protein IMP4